MLFFVRSLFPFALSPSPCSRLPSPVRLCWRGCWGCPLVLSGWPFDLGSSPGGAAGGAVCSVGRLCGAVPSVRPLGCALPSGRPLCVSPSAVLLGLSPVVLVPPVRRSGQGWPVVLGAGLVLIWGRLGSVAGWRMYGKMYKNSLADLYIFQG